MNYEWIHYGLLAFGLGACLILFLSLKREIWLLERKILEARDCFEVLLSERKQEIQQLRSDLQQNEERAERLVPAGPPKSGLNLAKRSQALRMFRRGEGPANIAAALGIPEREVELLLKVQKIVLEHV